LLKQLGFHAVNSVSKCSHSSTSVISCKKERAKRKRHANHC